MRRQDLLRCFYQFLLYALLNVHLLSGNARRKQDRLIEYYPFRVVCRIIRLNIATVTDIHLLEYISQSTVCQVFICIEAGRHFQQMYQLKKRRHKCRWISSAFVIGFLRLRMNSWF